MPEPYRIKIELDLSQVDRAAGRMTAAFAEAERQIVQSMTKTERATAASAERASQRKVEVAQREAARLEAIQDALALKDYRRTVAFQARKEREEQAAAAAEVRRAEQQAARLSALADRFAM